MSAPRDHGGGIDAAIARWGGLRSEWLDLSTGINPVPYPVGPFAPEAWTALPDRAAQADLIDAARGFWDVPNKAAILAAPGASAIIARLPALAPAGRVSIPAPTYNEHAAAFAAQDWEVSPAREGAFDAKVIVHPNNPDGRLWGAKDITAPLTIIDESFCDVTPEASLVHQAGPGVIVLKSFGKFWGLAGLRLGFAIGVPQDLARLGDFLGPWAVSGPALSLGAEALRDRVWAEETRVILAEDAARLDGLLSAKGAEIAGGTTLFRLYRVEDAEAWQDRLGQGRVLSRIFPYSRHWLRLGLPAPDRWAQLEAAL